MFFSRILTLDTELCLDSEWEYLTPQIHHQIENLHVPSEVLVLTSWFIIVFFLDDTKDIKFFYIVMKTPIEDSNSGRVKWTEEHSNIVIDIYIKGTHNGY